MSGSALSPDAPTVLFHNAAAERQAQAGATKRARIGSVALLESVEDALQLVLRNAPPLIFNNEAHIAETR